jgi:hypothetical protein
MNFASLLAAVAVTLGVIAPKGVGDQKADRPLAPDGQPGLGDEGSLRELIESVRATRDEGRQFVGQLLGLASEVRLLETAAAESYRAAGYFDLVAADANAEAIEEALHAAQLDPVRALKGAGERQRTFAVALLDARLRARLELAKGAELDANEVSRGLAVLRGADEGFVQLTEEEAQGIARRIDLAASRLRARRSDFLALRGRAGPSGRPTSDARESPEVVALLAAAADPDSARARAALTPLLESAQRRVDLMWSALAFTRLAQATAETLAWRERSLAEAARLRTEALTYLPESEQGRAAPMEIASMRKHERVRYSGFRAREGLAQDPLDDVLAYLAGHAADFQWGSIESRPLFDRFLVLRGIRHYDSRTLQQRKLDAWEEEALIVVQRAFEQPPPRPPPDKALRRGG